MDNHEIALEQQGGNAGASLRAKEEQELCFDYSTPVGTHFTVRFEDKAFFGRVLYGHQDYPLSFPQLLHLGLSWCVRSEDISDELEQTPASTAAHGDAKTSGSQSRGRGPDSKPESAWGQDTANHTINAPRHDYS